MQNLIRVKYRNNHFRTAQQIVQHVLARVSLVTLRQQQMRFINKHYIGFASGLVRNSSITCCFLTKAIDESTRFKSHLAKMFLQT